MKPRHEAPMKTKTVRTEKVARFRVRRLFTIIAIAWLSESHPNEFTFGRLVLIGRRPPLERNLHDTARRFRCREERGRCHLVELRVGRFDAEEIPVLAGSGKPGHVEDGMIRSGK